MTLTSVYPQNRFATRDDRRYHTDVFQRGRRGPFRAFTLGVANCITGRTMSTHHGIWLHVIFSTKYRKPWLRREWRDDLYGYIGGTVKEHDASLLKAGGTADHVHLLLRVGPQHAIASTIQLLKGNASKWINDDNKIAGKFQWQRGYGAFSVSPSSLETVIQYIANQEQHHRRKSFQEEYLEFLKKHKIDYDPRYVFESEILG